MKDTKSPLPDRTHRRIAGFIVAGIILYVVIDVVLTWLRPDYHWLHNAESDYGRGPYSWLMDLNFLLRCAVALVLAWLLRRCSTDHRIRRSAIWLIIWAIASGLLAFLPDNPYGYPKLATGSIHLLLATVAFIAVLGAMITVWRSAVLTKSARIATISTTIIAIGALILLVHAGGFRPNGLGGLYERIFLAAALAWQLILSWSLISEAHSA